MNGIDVLGSLAKYYAETDVICIIILGCLIYQTNHSNFIKSQKIQFTTVLVSGILFALSDLVWVFNNGFLPLSILPGNGIVISYVLNGGNVMLSAVSSMTWLMFSEGVQGESYERPSRKKIFELLLPAAVLLILTVTTPYTGLLFKITEDGEYVRGVGYAIQVMLAYGYVLVAVDRSLSRAKQAANMQTRKRSLSMASFMIGPSAAMILQLFIQNMPLLFIGVVIGMMNVFVSLQGQQVLIDPLTGLNNRSLLDQKINGKIAQTKEKSKLWLLLIDADKFKEINDIYGHLEGDRALFMIAGAIKKNCERQDYICRYGGDEFIILHEDSEDFKPAQLEEQINRELGTHETPYELRISLGGAFYTSDMKDWKDLIKIADQNLYLVKRAKYETRHTSVL